MIPVSLVPRVLRKFSYCRKMRNWISLAILSFKDSSALLQGCVILLASFTIEIAVSFCEKLRNVSYDTHNVFGKVVQWLAWKFHTILFSFFLARPAHARLLLSRDRPRPTCKRVDDRYDRFAPISARVSSFIGSLYPP